MPITFALAGAKADERDICSAMLSHAQIARDGQTIMADKGYRSADFEKQLKAAGISLIRPATKTEAPRAGKPFLKKLRQTIESIYDTLKDQLGLERHGGRTRTGVCVRILQRILALTTVIWHNQTTNRPGPARSLIAYDHSWNRSSSGETREEGSAVSARQPIVRGVPSPPSNRLHHLKRKCGGLGHLGGHGS